MSDNMLQTIRDYFATQPVQRAWLFGSYARGEEREDSDVDILVDFDQENASVVASTVSPVVLKATIYCWVRRTSSVAWLSGLTSSFLHEVKTLAPQMTVAASTMKSFFIVYCFSRFARNYPNCFKSFKYLFDLLRYV